MISNVSRAFEKPESVEEPTEEWACPSLAHGTPVGLILESKNDKHEERGCNEFGEELVGFP